MNSQKSIDNKNCMIYTVFVMNIAQNTVLELSVSDLSSAIKNTLEQGFNSVRVRGELSGVIHHRSGHIYMELKDDRSNVRTVCWRSNARSLKMRPENGLEVIVTGRITTYDKNSTYQLVVKNMEHAGVGALLALLEKRKSALQAEGLFDTSRKKPLPYLPQTVGVITSLSGAVIRDILHRIADRFALHVLVYPAKMQGDGTETEVCKGIEFFNNTPDNIASPDVIIIARGGGSMEDLWAFNGESIVRAVAQSHIAIVSAIGHETDTTLIDYASDVRAPTPTAAAEICVPVQADLLYTVDMLNTRLLHAIQGVYRHACNRVWLQKIPSLQYIISQKQNRYIMAQNSLQNSLKVLTTHHKTRLARINLVPPTQKAYTGWQNLTHINDRMKSAMVQILSTHQKHITHMEALLNSYSYKKTLQRGFALVQGADKTIIPNAKTAKQHTDLTLVFSDDTISVISKPCKP